MSQDVTTPPPQDKPQPPKAVQTVEQVFARPLLRAIVRKEYVTVLVMLANGDNPNVPDGSPFLTTPILLAADVGNVEIIELLLNAGAKLIARDEMGLTALTIAAIRGHTKAVDFLLRQGADPNAPTTAGATALMAAARRTR